MNEKIRIDKNLVIPLYSLYEAVAESKGVIDIHIDTTAKEINFKESFPDDLEIQKDIDLETLTLIPLYSLYEAVAESKGVIDIHIDTTAKEINFKESFPKEESKDDLEIQKDIDLETLTLILNLRSIF